MSPDGSTLYMSDGTAFIRVLDPKTMEEKAPRIQVHDVLDPKTMEEKAPRLQVHDILDPKTMEEKAQRIHVLAVMITNIGSCLIAGLSTCLFIKEYKTRSPAATLALAPHSLSFIYLYVQLGWCMLPCTALYI
jgi:hypothetical protein